MATRLERDTCVRRQTGPTPNGIDDPSIEYPSGEMMPVSTAEAYAVNYVQESLNNSFLDRPDVFVARDLNLYTQEGVHTTNMAPNVMVVLGADGKHDRTSWRTWEEGAVPAFVLMVSSENTLKDDNQDRPQAYERLGVTEYWRFDSTGLAGELKGDLLVGYRLVNDRYERLTLSDGNRGYSEVLGLELGVEDEDGVMRLRLYDPETGERLRNYVEAEPGRAEERAENERLREQVRRLTNGRTEEGGGR